MGRTGPATSPIVKFLELNPEEAGYPSNGIIILPGGSMKGASRVIGNFSHRFVPFSAEHLRNTKCSLDYTDFKTRLHRFSLLFH
jgi:hypothetical protein